MASAQEKVYGLHEFLAENPDEVSFRVGETILVVEKDDAYQDGWWQGTNENGETGLFPFSYTTLDRELAMNAKALALSAGGPQDSTQNVSTAQGATMTSTMADVDEALTQLRKGSNTNGAYQGDLSRRSFQSQRTGDHDDDEDEDIDGETDEGTEAEYQARGGARAALAAKAKANATSEAERERAEQMRLKAQAQKLFEEEEQRQRDMLLQKEAERKVAASKGTLVDADAEKPKVAPIDGVDISDESDSEGSVHVEEVGSTGNTTSAAQDTQTASKLESLALSDTKQQKLRRDDTADELDDIPSSRAPAANETNTSRSTAHIPAIASTSAAVAGIGAGAAAHLSSSRSNGAESHSLDQRSIDSSATRPPGSSQDDGVSTAPTSVGGGRDTPKSASGPAMGTPVVSLPASAAMTSSHSSASRPPPPQGDPSDWTVEQVVTWARSRGWDETTVVEKFAEHEISGDVLLEMDINILKEIDITAFGKRFQVANAIKELRNGPTGTTPLSPSTASVSGRDISSTSSPQIDESKQPAAAASPLAAAAAGTSLVGLGVPVSRPESIDTASAQRQRDISFDRGTVITHDVSAPRREESAEETALASHDGLSGSQRLPSQGKSLSEQADEALISRRQQPQRPLEASTSPRKREQGGRLPGSGERASFFSNFAPGRSRKAAPHSPSGPAAGSPTADAPSTDDTRLSKGTLSKLGLNRLAHRTSGGHTGSNAGSGDFKNQISLPTTSPTYDSMGDTARRSRISQMSGASANGAAGYSSPGNVELAPQQSASSSKQQSAESFAASAAAGSGGAVMSRIRPVDLEGWIYKKGEMYSSWKSRYLALKGTDLVILRDPNAVKIKGYISMKGYKVIGIADESATARKYGFKILHETEKPHYFSSDDPILVREWMKSLMKATIGRDNSFPVISSYNNATISLKEAQKMNPPPRPPSPTSRARTQRARVRENLTELTAKDKAILRVPDGQSGAPKAHASSNDESSSKFSFPRVGRRSMGEPLDLSLVKFRLQSRSFLNHAKATTATVDIQDGERNYRSTDSRTLSYGARRPTTSAGNMSASKALMTLREGSSSALNLLLWRRRADMPSHDLDNAQNHNDTAVGAPVYSSREQSCEQTHASFSYRHDSRMNDGNDDESSRVVQTPDGSQYATSAGDILRSKASKMLATAKSPTTSVYQSLSADGYAFGNSPLRADPTTQPLRPSSAGGDTASLSMNSSQRDMGTVNDGGTKQGRRAGRPLTADGLLISTWSTQHSMTIAASMELEELLNSTIELCRTDWLLDTSVKSSASFEPVESGSRSPTKSARPSRPPRPLPDIPSISSFKLDGCPDLAESADTATTDDRFWKRTGTEDATPYHSPQTNPVTDQYDRPGADSYTEQDAWSFTKPDDSGDITIDIEQLHHRSSQPQQRSDSPLRTRPSRDSVLSPSPFSEAPKYARVLGLTERRSNDMTPFARQMPSSRSSPRSLLAALRSGSKGNVRDGGIKMKRSREQIIPHTETR